MRRDLWTLWNSSSGEVASPAGEFSFRARYFNQFIVESQHEKRRRPLPDKQRLVLGTRRLQGQRSGDRSDGCPQENIRICMLAIGRKPSGLQHRTVYSTRRLAPCR
jgi:hypothetical protein